MSARLGLGSDTVCLRPSSYYAHIYPRQLCQCAPPPPGQPQADADLVFGRGLSEVLWSGLSRGPELMTQHVAFSEQGSVTCRWVRDVRTVGVGHLWWREVLWRGLLGNNRAGGDGKEAIWG